MFHHHILYYINNIYYRGFACLRKELSDSFVFNCLDDGVVIIDNDTVDSVEELSLPFFNNNIVYFAIDQQDRILSLDVARYNRAKEIYYNYDLNGQHWIVILKEFHETFDKQYSLNFIKELYDSFKEKV